MSDMFFGFSVVSITHVDVVDFVICIFSTIFDMSTIVGILKKMTALTIHCKNQNIRRIYKSFTSKNCHDLANKSLNCGRASYASKSYKTVQSSTQATRYILLFAKNSASSFFAFTRFQFLRIKISFHSMIAPRISSASLKI